MLQKIFDMDNGFMRGLSRVTDLVILNVLFLICSIPIVTFGPALVALYSMTLKMVKNEEPYIVKGYFSAFKKNFKQGIFFGVLCIVIAVVIGVDLFLISVQQGAFAKVIKVICIAVGIFVYLIFLYVYPITARFDMKPKAILRNAFLMAIGHLPQTVLLSLMNVPIFALAMYSELTMYLLLTIMIIIGCSLLAFCQSFLLRRIFKNYELEEEQDEIE